MPRPSSAIARAERVVLVVVDIQEALFPFMQDPDALSARAAMLMRGAEILGVPIILSEQYKKGLGDTIPAIAGAAEASRFEKATFSCFGDQEIAKAIRATERDQILVCGIETHICVLQTCLDAVAEGYEVFLAADACSTRLAHTGLIGIDRMREAGVALGSAEGFLFEMLERCDSDAFKRILPLVREGS